MPWLEPWSAVGVFSFSGSPLGWLVRRWLTLVRRGGKRSGEEGGRLVASDSWSSTVSSDRRAGEQAGRQGWGGERRRAATEREGGAAYAEEEE